MKSVIEIQRVYVKFHNNWVTIHVAMLALKATIQHNEQIASNYYKMGMQNLRFYNS